MIKSGNAKLKRKAQRLETTWMTFHLLPFVQLEEDIYFKRRI